MKDLAPLLATPAFRRLGWALAAFLWQGTLVAAILSCVNALLSRRDPRARYAAGCAALLLMVLLPAATYLGHRETSAPRSAPTGVSPTPAGEPLPHDFAVNRTADGGAPEYGGIARAFQASAAWLSPWIVPAWLCGVLLLSARFLAGWNAARRLPLKGVRPAPAALKTVLERLCARLGIDRRVRLLESVRVSVPTALGVLRPAILMPVCAVTGLSPEAIEAVLAHELAHIRRHDYLVNLIQTAAETLLFYHPAVWWVSRRIRIERENCCDDLAVVTTGDSRGYVRALVVLEEIRAPRLAAPSPAVAADGASLWRRVARLMPASSFPSPSLAEDAPRWLAGLLALAMVATIGAAARASFFEDSPVVAVGLPVPPAGPTNAVPAAQSPRPQKENPVTATRRAARVSGVAGGIAGGVTGGVEEGVEGGVSGGIEGGLEADGEEKKTASAQSEVRLSSGDLASLRRHGVTPDFLAALAAQGYKQATVQDLLALRIHGVSPEYVSEMTALVGKQSLDEIVSLRIHGVTPEFVRRFHEAGYPQISADEAVSLRIHGVDPDDATQWATITGRKPGLDEIVSARIHGATPEYARQMRSLGLDADLDALVGLRIHGVTPEFVRDMRSLGYTKLSTDDAVACRIHGVTPDFVKEVQSLGYAAPSVDELTALRIHGATPEFIRKANASAGARLSIDELVSRRIHGRNP
jgi:bla regulator protein blaR1